MNHNFEDLSGRSFNHLKVVKYAGPNINGGARWECRCQCGKIHTVDAGGLKRGRPKSCGCMSSAIIKATVTTHGEGRPPTVEYQIWIRMRQRCSNPRCDDYRLYGGRGIKVCKRWDSYILFLKDMGRRPSKRHSLDRKNNDLGYSPSNCHWATPSQQSRNKRTTVVTHKMASLIRRMRTLGRPIADIAAKLGIKSGTIYSVIRSAA